MGGARRARGELTVNGRAIEVAGPGCHPLVEHPHHTAGVLELAVGAGLECHMTCFTPGVASSRCPRSPSRRMSRGGPPSSSSDGGARPVGRVVGRSDEEVRAGRPTSPC